MQWINQKVVRPFKTSCSQLSNDAIAEAMTAGVVGGIVRPPPPPPPPSALCHAVSCIRCSAGDAYLLMFFLK